MVVPLAVFGWEAVDCRSGSLEAPLWLGTQVRPGQKAPGGVLGTQIEPSLTVIPSGVAGKLLSLWVVLVSPKLPSGSHSRQLFPEIVSGAVSVLPETVTTPVLPVMVNGAVSLLFEKPTPPVLFVMRTGPLKVLPGQFVPPMRTGPVGPWHSPGRGGQETFSWSSDHPRPGRKCRSRG